MKNNAKLFSRFKGNLGRLQKIVVLGDRMVLTMQYNHRDRVTACPPIHVGREPGMIKSIEKDACGTVYQVELDKYPGKIFPFRAQDLEMECSGGGAHEWDGEICVKCFEAKG